MGNWHKTERENLAATLSDRRMGGVIFTIIGAILLISGILLILIPHGDPELSGITIPLIFMGIIAFGGGLLGAIQRKPLYIVFHKQSLLLRTHFVNKRVHYEQIVAIGDGVDDKPYIKLKSGTVIVLQVADFDDASTSIPQFKKLLQQANPKIRLI